MGQTFSSGLKQAVFLPKPLFTVDDMPDLSGKVIIVTGGNAGIGKETIKVLISSCLPHVIQMLTTIHQALLVKNAKVYLAARNKSKADKAISELKQSTGKEAIFLELDLANLKSIKKSAETFLRYCKCYFVCVAKCSLSLPAWRPVWMCSSIMVRLFVLFTTFCCQCAI